jgi:Kdo2-lipid IVA lauroyltransferase/acyltransferase
MSRRKRNLFLDRLQAGLTSLLLGCLKLLPFQSRRTITASLARLVVTTTPALRRRITANFARVWPGLPVDRQAQLVAEVGSGFGLTMIEIYSPADLARHHADFPVSGAGLDALKLARSQGKGALLVSGHFGQWEAIRIALRESGMETGAVYRPNNNQYYDRGFLAAIRQIGEPILPNNAAGTRAMLRHVREGGFMAMLIDQHIKGTPLLSFFGKPARTSTFPAELALKFGLPLIACYGIRRADGRHIDVVLEAPIPHTDALTMTQALNDSLEARVRAHPGQWHWLHHRWRDEASI